MYYLGIDHHKRYSQVAIVDEKSEVRTNRKIANEKKAFTLLKEYYKEPFRAVIEAGRNWGMMYDLLEELDIETIVGHPLKTRAIADAKIKSDFIDAKTLAHLLRADLIPEVHVPSKEVREQKNLLRHRLWLVRFQTMTITGNPGRDNDCGILLQDSSNDNTLEDNTTSNNSEWGIILQGSCNDNELINNIA